MLSIKSKEGDRKYINAQLDRLCGAESVTLPAEDAERLFLMALAHLDCGKEHEPAKHVSENDPGRSLKEK